MTPGNASIKVENPKIVIELMPDGKVQVNGPLTQKILCLGMISLAKHIITTYDTEQQSRIAVPPPIDMNKFKPKG